MPLYCRETCSFPRYQIKGAQLLVLVTNYGVDIEFGRKWIEYWCAVLQSNLGMVKYVSASPQPVPEVCRHCEESVADNGATCKTNEKEFSVNKVKIHKHWWKTQVEVNLTYLCIVSVGVDYEAPEAERNERYWLIRSWICDWLIRAWICDWFPLQPVVRRGLSEIVRNRIPAMNLKRKNKNYAHISQKISRSYSLMPGPVDVVYLLGSPPGQMALIKHL